MSRIQPKLLDANSTIARSLRSEAEGFTLGPRRAPLTLAIPDTVVLPISRIRPDTRGSSPTVRTPLPTSHPRPASAVAAEMPVPRQLRSRWGGDTTIVQAAAAALDKRSALATVKPHLARIGVPATVIDDSVMSFVSLQMRPPTVGGGSLRLVNPPPAARTASFLLGLRAVGKNRVGVLIVLPSGGAASATLRLPLDAETDEPDGDDGSHRRDRHDDLPEDGNARLRPPAPPPSSTTPRDGDASTATGSADSDDGDDSQDTDQNGGYGGSKDQDFARCFSAALDDLPEWATVTIAGVCAACVSALGLLLVPAPVITGTTAALICGGCGAAIAAAVGVGVLACHEMLGD